MRLRPYVMISPMKTILCFGDSNTWGALPGTEGSRAPLADRWPSVMARQLNVQNAGAGKAGPGRDGFREGAAEVAGGYHVIAEGLNGRTTVYDDPMSPGRSGIAALPMLLDTHAPIDLVIIMLGTNDTKNFFQVSAEQIARGMEVLVRAVAASDAGPVGGEAAEVVGTGTGGVAVRWPPVGPVPRLLIVAPTPIGRSMIACGPTSHRSIGRRRYPGSSRRRTVPWRRQRERPSSTRGRSSPSAPTGYTSISPVNGFSETPSRSRYGRFWRTDLRERLLR
jgi:lysophospholipase L1-like esterase